MKIDWEKVWPKFDEWIAQHPNAKKFEEGDALMEIVREHTAEDDKAEEKL